MESSINIIDLPVTLTPNDDHIDQTLETLTPTMSEEDFQVTIEQQLSRANAYWDKLRIKARREVNTKYYLGDQVDKSGLRDDLEKGSDNVLFRNIETMLTIANSRTPELICTPVYKNDDTRKYATNTRLALQTEWEDVQNMKVNVGRAIRNHQMEFVGVLKVGQDPDTGEFWTKEVIAEDLVINKDGSFVGHYIKDKTVGFWLSRFPKKRKEILEACGFNTNTPDVDRLVKDTPVTCLEAWTDDVVGWRIGPTTVLGIAKNPHFDYTGKEYEIPDPNAPPQMDDMGNMQPVTARQKVLYNHFKKPRKPFLFLVYWNRGIHVLDDTTLLEQGIGLQDWVNKRKRQIGANIDSLNGHWISSGDFIAKDEFMKIEGGVDEKIWLEMGKPADGVMHVVGEPLDQIAFQDLNDSRSGLDNLMGMHATTRGEQSGNKTATQDIMQKDQDYGRIDGYVRDGVEPFAKAWFEYMYQMFLVYSDTKRNIAIPEEDDNEAENITFTQDSIPLVQTEEGKLTVIPLVFRVKQGSTLPKDEASQWQMAQQFKDILSPLDYFKMTGQPNPRELTRNLLMWQQDPFFLFKDDPKVQEFLQLQQQKAQQQMMAQQQQLGAQQQGDMQSKQMEMDQKMEMEKMKMEGQKEIASMRAPVKADGKPQPQSNGKGEVSAEGVGKALASIMQNRPA